MRASFLLPVLLGSALVALPPKAFSEFAENGERLLSTYQYSVLSEYATAYLPQYAGDARLGNLAWDWVRKIPRFEARQKLLKAVVDLKDADFSRSRFQQEYALGLLWSGDTNQALAWFRRGAEPARRFYEGEILRRSGQAGEARDAYLAFLKDFQTAGSAVAGGSDLASEARLHLAELALERGSVASAQAYLAQSGSTSLEATALRARIAKLRGDEAGFRASTEELRRAARVSGKARKLLDALPGGPG